MTKQSKNALTPEDKMRLLIAVADLPFVSRKPKSTDYMRDVQLTVLDFHMHATVVGKAIGHFTTQVQGAHGIHTHEQLAECLARYPDTPEGNAEASVFLWNNRHWKRAGYLRGLLAFLKSIGVHDQTSLHAWAKTAQFERDFQGKVPGLGLAVFHWLLIRCGVSTIKPDVWVIKFAERITGKRLSDKVLVELFNELSPLVRESMVTIDMTIWAYERMGMAVNDVPALRVVFWKQVKQRLEARLKEDEAFKAGQWRVDLDNADRVRYDQAGVRMTGLIRLPGEAQAVMTTFEVMQSNWRERFQLRLTMRRDWPFGEAVLAEIRPRLETAGWVVGEDGARVSYELETELFMPPETSIAELMGQAGGVVDRMVKAVSLVGRAGSFQA